MGAIHQALLMASGVAGGGGSIPAANLALWLKADAITGLGNGDPVATWLDSSVNGNDATQSTGANKPLYLSDSLGFLPTVWFDGTNDVLSLASSVLTGAGTLFVVGRTGSVGNFDARPLVGVSAGSGFHVNVDRSPAGGLIGFAGVGTPAGSIRQTFWYLLTITKTGGGSAATEIRLNLASAASGTGSATSAGLNLIGGTAGGSPWHGSISEVIAYSTVLSAGDIDNVEAYLDDKYAITDTRQLWLKGDAITGKSDGDSLSSWPDQSGKGNHFSTASGFTDAIYKTGLQNSLPGVRFGTGTGMTGTAQSPLFVGATPYTIYVVYDYRSASSEFRRALQGSNNWLIGPYQNTHKCYSGGFSTGLAVTQNVFVVQWVVGSGSSNTNNVAGTSYTSGGADAPGQIGLSSKGISNEILDGDILEVIIESTANTNGATDATYLALKSKYSL
jgi:hypothetical protein